MPRSTAQDLQEHHQPLLETLPHRGLLDSRTGIVRSLREARIPSHFPRDFLLVTAALSETTRFAPWASDPAGAGYAIGNPAAALGAALGEAAERYCGNAVPRELTRGTARQLRRSGRRVVDLGRLALFSTEQLRSPGFPAVALDDDLEVEWARGADLGTGEEVLVPASLVWPSYAGSRGPGHPLTNPIVQAGLAAGQTRQDAVAAALREVVERDAMTLSWYGGRGVLALVVPPWLELMGRGPGGALTTRWIALHQEFGVPVVAALVQDSTTGYLSMGVGVGGAIDAAVKALGEALQLLLVLADYDDPSTGLGRAGGKPGSPLKAWRQDRRYGAAYRADRRDVVDYACHLQLHLDPAVQDAFDAELHAATRGSIPLEDLVETGSPGEELQTSGIAPVVVDLTTTDVRTSGLDVVRVVAPGLYSNSPLGLPFLGGHRLQPSRTNPPRTPWPH
ncbi:YcaO-like family protein [Actinotalea sp. C106]|uniref:YcaO-like family protein n=1 Tax=Actinotalea sp. C106 TaxID=2908644 RepID=UPI00202789F9|nr:YcaO-like family protein [Actinotalea sp. C106]